MLYCLCNSNQAGEQDIQLTNDKIVVGQYSDPKKAQQGKPVNQGRTELTNIVMQEMGSDEHESNQSWLLILYSLVCLTVPYFGALITSIRFCRYIELRPKTSVVAHKYRR